MNLKIISAKSTKLLEEEASKYNITQLGSITVSNGQYFLCFLGELKLTKPKTTTSKKTTTKRKPKNENSTSTN